MTGGPPQQKNNGESQSEQKSASDKKFDSVEKDDLAGQGQLGSGENYAVDKTEKSDKTDKSDKVYDRDKLDLPASVISSNIVAGGHAKNSDLKFENSLKAKPPEGDPKSREFTLPKGVDLNAAEDTALFYPSGASNTSGMAGAGLSGVKGLKQHFQLRKSEFKRLGADTEEGVQNLEKIRPNILELLARTPIKNDKKLTSAERAGLYESRDALLESADLDEALSNALHLARLYQHLRYIEEAKRATLLALGIDPDNQLGKQLLKELERVQQVDSAILGQFVQAGGVQDQEAVQPLTKSALKKRILNLSGGKVCVVGDLLIDELIEGRPERISREAPVLILEHVDSVLIPGGAANTAHNVSAFNGKCHAVGVCGSDDYAPRLAKLLEDHGISHALIEDPTRPTTIKTRIVSKSHALMQQLLRIDRISHQKVSASIEAKLIAAVERAAETYNAIILSDYKSGVITDGVIAAVRKCAEKHKTMVIVDAQGSFERFAGCTLMTPNQPDAEAAAGFKITDRQSLQRLGETLLEKSGVEALLVTRGGDGMVLFERDKAMFELPAFNRQEVFDVTGAGDTVVATMALALTSGATLPEAMALGNLAASIVVRKPGTEVTSQKEMLEHLELLHLPD